ncbi:MAG: NAD(P)/FAD-dependent oxidoreductase [Deinococcus sp.]
MVGGGPAGLYAAFYAGLRGLSVRLLEARPEPGGQLMALYPERLVYDVPAAPATPAAEIVGRLLSQLEPLGTDIRLGELALSLEADGDGWTGGGRHGRYRAGAVIVAAGLGALLPRQDDWPSLDAPPAAGQHLWVQGGVPQATRAALELRAAGARVTLSHSRALLRGTPAQLTELEGLRREGRIELVAPAPAGFTPTPAPDQVLRLGGYRPNLSPLKGWPLGWQGEYVAAGANGSTRLPGVYVAGDVVAYDANGDGRPGFRLISLAFAQAALCANHAARHVRPELRLRPGHSSEHAPPGVRRD